MTLSRRKTLALLGGGTLIAATAGAGAFISTRTPKDALAPWSEAGGYAEVRRRALSFGILAPNPHNRQPWIVDFEGDDRVVVYRDPERNLPETDPFDRQLTIGMGCFLELTRIAASTTGHGVDISLFPEGEGADLPVAILTFVEGAEADPLAAHILDRRSCKEPFEARDLPAEAIEALAPFATILTDPQKVMRVQDLTVDAFRIEMFHPATLEESVDLMRFGKAEINANPDGINLGGPFLEGMMLAGLLTPQTVMDLDNAGTLQQLESYLSMLRATPAYAVLISPGNTRTDQIKAGQQWLRLNLTTTSLGLALHPVSQALQEFDEMAEPYARAHAMLAPEGHTVQMLGRLGFGPTVARTPRWTLETRITNV